MSETTVRPDGPQGQPDRVTPDVRHFAALADAYTLCGLERATVRWTDDPATPVDCLACTAPTPEPDEDDEDDIVPAPGCGHLMPPGVDCCVSTQAPVEVPVCLAASRHGGICGQPAPCDGSRHVAPAPVSAERRTVSLEVLTDELRAEEEERRRVEAREEGVSFEPIPAEARVVVMARIDGLAAGVLDHDTEWMCTGADLLLAMLRSASDLAADGEAELLMPTPDVLAALDGRPDAGFWTAPVPVTARAVEEGWIVVGYSGPGVEEPIETKRKDCDGVDCPWPGDCTQLTIGDSEPAHFADWTTLTVRIPATVTQ